MLFVREQLPTRQKHALHTITGLDVVTPAPLNRPRGNLPPESFDPKIARPGGRRDGREPQPCLRSPPRLFRQCQNNTVSDANEHGLGTDNRANNQKSRAGAGQRGKRRRCWPGVPYTKTRLSEVRGQTKSCEFKSGPVPTVLHSRNIDSRHQHAKQVRSETAQ